MKNWKSVLFSVVAVGMFCSVAQARDVEVSISNNTGKTMTYLYISTSGTQSWEDDILGPQYLGIRTLEHNRYCEFVMDDSPTWDLRAEFRDGSYQEYYGIDFKEGRGVTLNRNNAQYD